MPSMWGQSEPKITRSTPTASITSSTWSSQNGLTQTWRRKVSTGSSGNQPFILRASTRSRSNIPGRNLEPFSTEATRRLGNRWKRLSQIRADSQSSTGRSSWSMRIGWGTPPKSVVKPSLA